MYDLRGKHVIQGEPNFTAILPGVCQARCRFCVEPDGPRPASTEAYMEAFQGLLGWELPPIFRTLSISGGEPTLSPALPGILVALNGDGPKRFQRVVLTTNGCDLAKHLGALRGAVTHVNLSRHAPDDAANQRVFKTSKVPSAEGIKSLASSLGRLGIPVNLNCVYSADHFCGEATRHHDRQAWRKKAKGFVDFAKSVGAGSLVLRLDHRCECLQQTPLDEAFDDYLPVYTDSCPSCSVVVKVIRGMSVTFKKSVYEPTRVQPQDELHELVLHADGRLCADWSRRQEIARPIPDARWYPDAVHRPPGLSPLVDGCGQPHGCRPYMLFPERPNGR